MQDVAVDEVFGFLKNIPPFQFLEDDVLREVAGGVSLHYFPAGAVIHRQGGPPSDNLYVIKKGGAKVFVVSEGGEESLVDYRAPGDVIGFVSLYTADRARTNVVATEDTICYLVGREDFRRLLDSHPPIREYLHRAFLHKYLDRALHEMRTRSLFVGGGERLLFTTPVADLLTGAVITAPIGVSIQTAAGIMASHHISSLVIVRPDGSPAGLITDRDLRDKAVAKGRSFAEPATSIMSETLHTVDARDYCFEALLAMIHHGIHHLLVVEGAAPRGVITNHDLMILQGTSPLSVSQEIELQQDIPGLAFVARKVSQITSLLLKEGASAGNLMRIVTELNDRIVRRVLEIGERHVGVPPLPYAWLAFGSEGRGEQVFRTDQDNGILFDEPGSPALREAAELWFAAFTAFVQEAFAACGYPPCPGGKMASNPVWRQPLPVWKKYFSDWLVDPAGKSPLKSMIFFDFRVVHGDLLLGERLRDHVFAQLAGQRSFFNYVANQLVRNRPPIGFFGSLLVEKTGEHKDQFNLKARGINPLVDTVRFFALENGCRETATLARIEALRGTHSIVKDYADDLARAFDFLALLRVHRQYEQSVAGCGIDNFINPDQLTNLEKRSVKEAFNLISRLQDQIVERYRAAIL
jgi:CBS domain-containing protein